MELKEKPSAPEYKSLDSEKRKQAVDNFMKKLAERIQKYGKKITTLEKDLLDV